MLLLLLALALALAPSHKRTHAHTPLNAENDNAPHTHTCTQDAAFMRLAEDRFYNTYPCIILTAKGQPDVATRLFLRRLKTSLNIPVLALVDSDPYGKTAWR